MPFEVVVWNLADGRYTIEISTPSGDLLYSTPASTDLSAVAVGLAQWFRAWQEANAAFANNAEVR
jgi:hypothetical protein